MTPSSCLVSHPRLAHLARFRGLSAFLASDRTSLTLRSAFLVAQHAFSTTCRLPQARTLRVRNGTKEPMAIFPPAEFEHRLTSLRRRMASDQIDAILFTSIHNVNYFSGFLYCAFGRPYGMFVTHDDETTTTISAGIDGGQPWRRSHCENVVYTDWERDSFYHAVANAVHSSHVSTLGFEADHLTLEAWGKLKAALCDYEVSLKDVSETVMRQRMVKSAHEVELIRAGARIADVGGFAAVDACGIGVAEYEVALAATGAMVREIAASFPAVELMDTWTWFQSGQNTDGAHNPLTSRRVSRGDIISLNTFPMIGGYYTALERTLFMGEVPSDAHLRAWEANVDVHERGLALLVPGVRCCDVALELNELYREKGLLQYRSFGYGHSFGTLCHYYGREAGLELREDIKTVLQPGHVVSMEPMIMIPEGTPGAGGYREHDILLITQDGNENLTKFPYGPAHNVLHS